MVAVLVETRPCMMGDFSGQLGADPTRARTTQQMVWGNYFDARTRCALQAAEECEMTLDNLDPGSISQSIVRLERKSTHLHMHILME